MWAGDVVMNVRVAVVIVAVATGLDSLAVLLPFASRPIIVRYLPCWPVTYSRLALAFVSMILPVIPACCLSSARASCAEARRTNARPHLRQSRCARWARLWNRRRTFRAVSLIWLAQ